MGDLPHPNTATSKRPKVSFSERHSGQAQKFKGAGTPGNVSAFEFDAVKNSGCRFPGDAAAGFSKKRATGCFAASRTTRGSGIGPAGLR
jgi:hypothetical protein